MFKGNLLPVARWIGLDLTCESRDRYAAQFIVRDELCTREASLHGGVMMAEADVLGAMATVMNIDADRATTTIESKTNFLAGVPRGERARAECVPLHRGSTTMVWETRILREDGSLAAVVTQTQLVTDARPVSVPKTPSI
jgi:1,4-dihydroxy-2-naphthoyl-CoA hydrolase